MSSKPARLTTNGNGYEQIQAWDDRGNQGVLQHHRVLAWVWGDLEELHFSEEIVEVHHEKTGIPWLNVEWNLEALTPEEHKRVDEGRARISAPWDRVGQQQLATDGSGDDVVEEAE